MVKLSVKCRVLDITEKKKSDLDHEYEGFQWWMQFGIDKDILSQHKRAKGHTFKKDQIKYKEYPLVIPKKQVWYRHNDNKLSNHWLKISVRKRKGIGIWLPIRPHKKLPDFKYLCDSMLVKTKKGYYEFRLVFDIPSIPKLPKELIVIDFGERNIATVLSSASDRMFLGREIRGLRAHYSYLRKMLGKKKLIKKIKEIADKEQRIVTGKLHNISNTIINLALKRNAIIVFGKLKRFKKVFSKKLNRMISNMPFFKLRSFIKYKAEWNGIRTFDISEYNSSKKCHFCDHVDKKNRVTQGLFKCRNCGIEYNADLNACHNHFKRAYEQDLLGRALADAQKLVGLNSEQVSR
jgi:putative transposase